jgi:hypothetical protein
MARADSARDPAKADVLFNSAKYHISEGNYSVACSELRESESLDPQVGTTMNLADCHEHLERFATAWSFWLQAASFAAAKGEHDREDFARSRARQLEAKLLRATVVVAKQPAGEGLRLAIDDVALPETAWGVPIPLDPGEHELLAMGEGFRPWRQSFSIAQGLEPTLLVPELEPAAPAMPPSAPRGRSPWPAVTWTTGAVGVAALGVGAAFAGASVLNEDASNATHSCAKSGCNPTGSADRARAKDDGVVATVMLVTGGVAILAATTMYFTLRWGHSPSGSWTAAVSPMAAGGVTTLTRSW